MVKFNYKTSRVVPDISSLEGEAKTEETLISSQPQETVKTTAPEMDTSFDSTDSFFEKSEPEPESSFVAEEEAPSPKAQDSLKDYGDEEEGFSFKDTFADKKIYAIGGAVILVLIIVLFAIFYLTGDDGEKIATVKTTTQEIEKATDATPAAPAPASPLARFLIENQHTNNYLNRQFSKLTSVQSEAAQISMINISSGRLSMTILGDTRDAIVEFHMQLKKNFPTFNLQLMSVGKKVDGLSEKLYGDILGSFSLPPAPTGDNAALQAPKDINLEKDFRSLVKSARLQLKEFKTGKIIRKSDHIETVYYASLKGGKQQILSLFNRLATAYPALKINKFTMFAENLGAINGKPLAANINMTYFSEK